MSARSVGTTYPSPVYVEHIFHSVTALPASSRPIIVIGIISIQGMVSGGLWLVLVLLGLSTSVFGRTRLGEPPLPRSFRLPSEQWHLQRLDHFDPTNTATWQQRYWTNDTFWKVEGDGPVFLMIGGEGEATPNWMVTGAWIQFAQKYSALCFQLEHRFYGKSRPTEDMSDENLRYLSSEQALADLAHFIEAKNAEMGLGEGNKWVLFGGSYPGSLAAWMRIKYPHLVHASVSTSGPLVAVVDFPQYFKVVEESLGTYSSDCVEATKAATQQLELLLTHPLGMKSASKQFKLCGTIDASNKLDVSTLFNNLSEMFADVVQYNKDNRISKSSTSNITIEDICGIMTNLKYGDPIDRLAKLNSWMLNLSNETCRDFDYKKSIKELQETSWESEASEGGRQWTYQTCTEFGFFQTSSSSKELFRANIPLQYYIQQCSDIFGPRFNASLLEKGVERSNMMYGGLGLRTYRVVFVHGTIDPWHALGMTVTKWRSAPAILIEGTAHCADMYPSSDRDPPQLVKARDRISQLIGKWLFTEELP